MTKGEIEKAAAQWRERWEKFPGEDQLRELGFMPSEQALALVACAMIGMSTQATVELVKQLIKQAAE